MPALHPNQIWWSPSELATACLPDLPTSRRRINSMADRLGWQLQTEFARRRSGRGGGWEYHWELLPVAARKKLLAEATEPTQKAPKPEQAEIWVWYDGLPRASKDKAEHRLETLRAVTALERAGHTRFLAVEAAAERSGVSSRTIWNWLGMVEGVGEPDWLAYLAPRNKGAVRHDTKADCDPEFIDLLKGDYLRLERPSFAACYRRVMRIAAQKGLRTLPDRTARRRLNEIVPRVTQVFAREGYIGLARCFPPQTRDRSNMVALEGVNADCHKIDVFVEWPDGTIDRPQIVAFQDIYSGKFLSWRVDHSPNKVAVMAAFGDMIEDYGIPQHCLFDNGMEFANKWLTGGTKTRFRFKIREDDPLGVLPHLGIEVHWATPAHGQAKPIERAFRDFADDIAKDPRFAGAYVGNRPDAKPENYGSKAVPVAEFLRVVEDGISEHNAREGRLSKTALGRSFDDTFAQSYANAVIRKATAEQRRLWLMGQAELTTHRGSGLVKLHGNEYWSDWMNEFAGQKIVARFDPEDLHAGLHLYALDGAYLGLAACKLASGFFDLTAAQETARQASRIKRLEKKLLDELRPKTVADVAAELDDLKAASAKPMSSKVVKPNFGRKAKTAALMAPKPPVEADPNANVHHAAFVAKFEAKKAQEPDRFTPAKDARSRFKQAMAIKQVSDAGGRIGEAEARWYREYCSSSEYRGELRVQQNFQKGSTP